MRRSQPHCGYLCQHSYFQTLHPASRLRLHSRLEHSPTTRRLHQEPKRKFLADSAWDKYFTSQKVKWSGRLDSNQRPPAPCRVQNFKLKRKGLNFPNSATDGRYATRLRYAPTNLAAGVRVELTFPFIWGPPSFSGDYPAAQTKEHPTGKAFALRQNPSRSLNQKEPGVATTPPPEIFIHTFYFS